MTMSTGDGIEADGERDAVEEPLVEDDRPTVTVSRTRPERLVFLEDGNTDAWIATDLVVDPER